MIHRESSTEAYHFLIECGHLSQRRSEVYDVLYHHGPLTAGEVYQQVFRKWKLPSNSNAVTRLGELRDMGLVKKLGERQCSVTKMTVILWDVTDRVVPLPLGTVRRRKVWIAFDDHGKPKFASAVPKEGYILFKEALR